MRKYIILTIVLSIITILFTIFIYSPQFIKERNLLVKKILVLNHKNKEVRLEKGSISGTSSLTSVPTPSAYLVIVLDDFGYEYNLIDKLHNLNLPINPSIIPFLPHSKDVLKKSKKYGLDPLLHLPMEPKNPNLNPGKGAIYVNFSDEEIKRRTEEALNVMTGIIGVNNHMGSRATSSKRVMRDVIEVIKTHNLFFLDSFTTSSSIGYKVAKEEGLPPLKRDIFLDNNKEEKYIEEQLNKFTDIALKKGSAIGIGHANIITIHTISNYISIWKEKQLKVISLKEYVDRGLWRGKD